MAAMASEELIRLVGQDLQKRVPGLLFKGYVQRLPVWHHRCEADQTPSGKILNEGDLIEVDNAITQRNEFFHRRDHGA